MWESLTNKGSIKKKFDPKSKKTKKQLKINDYKLL